MNKILKVVDLLKAIDYITGSRTSNDNFDECSKNPIFILVHNEIKKFNSLELESCIGKNKWYSLSDYAFKNSFLLSAFIEQGAFINKLTNSSKWILDSGIKIDSFLYETISYIEDDFRRQNRQPLNQKVSNDNDKDILFYFLFENRPNNKVNLMLLEKYYNNFCKTDKNKIINFIFKNAGKNFNDGEICNFLYKKLCNEGFDFTSSNILNNLLPKETTKTIPNEIKNFFISSIDIPRIKFLLDYGFRFDEKEYSYYGDNLFISIIKSGREDIIRTILPTLSNVITNYGNKLENEMYIQELIKKSPNKEFIESIYQKCLLDSELNNQNKHQARIKI